MQLMSSASFFLWFCFNLGTLISHLFFLFQFMSSILRINFCTFDLEDDPPADGGGHAVLSDAEVGAHVVFAHRPQADDRAQVFLL